jgi:hypothetical protein
MATEFEGHTGTGKTLFILYIVACITTGKPWINAAPPFGPAGVVLLSTEDVPESVIKPRILALGGDPDMVHVIPSVIDDGKGGKRSIYFPRDTQLVANAMASFDRCGLLVVDPLEDYADPKLDMSKSHHVRQIFAHLNDLARTFHCGIIALRHLNKDNKSTNPLTRGMGSMGFQSAARISFLVGQHPEDKLLHVVAPIKCNVAPLPPSLSFRTGHNEKYHTVELEWAGEVSTAAQELLVENLRPGTKASAATRLLVDQLSGKGWALAARVRDRATMLHVDEMTLTRARKTLGAETIEIHGDPPRWVWFLPTVCGHSFDPLKDPAVVEAVTHYNNMNRKLGGTDNE